jgi:membrane protein
MSSHSHRKQKFDDFQSRHHSLAFPLAIFKRYGDDEIGRCAALITYYAFLALFPLLLIFITILSIMITEDPELRASITSAVFQYFPALGGELQSSVRTLRSSGWVLLLELLILLYGARGLAHTLQYAFNYVWHLDKHHDPGFFGNNLRSFAMMISVGVGIVIGAVLSYIIGTILDVGLLGVTVITLLNVAFTCALFLLVFRLGTAPQIKTHWLIPGALLAGSGVLVVQHFGGYLASSHLHKLDSTYGSFALALGVMFWLYVQAHLIMFALVTTAVRAQKDYPKSLFGGRD